IAEPFCPIYCEARESSPWKQASSAHAGLLFDKFAYAWRYDRDNHFAFDKGNKDKRDRDRSEHEVEGWWLKSDFPKRYVASESLLSEACSRQQALVETLGGIV